MGKYLNSQDGQDIAGYRRKIIYSCDFFQKNHKEKNYPAISCNYPVHPVN
jgi:hypothetical protein